MDDTRMFHIGDILTITTGILLSPEHIGGVYKILEYMTDDKPFTHQLPRYAKECKPYLVEAFPQFADIDCSDVNERNFEKWLDDVVTKYGAFHPVRPIGAEDHEHIGPIEELINMGVDADKIIVVNAEATNANDN